MLRIRLARLGRRSRPHYRVVVAERSWGRDGRRIDELGHYDPLTEPSTVVLDVPRTEEWIRRGAQPSERVAKLLKIARNAPPVGKAPAPAPEPPSAAPAPEPEAAAPADETPKAAAKVTAKTKPKAKAKPKSKAKPKAKAAAKKTAKTKAASSEE